MFFHNALKKLDESKVYKDWRKDNSKAILSTGFIVIEKDSANPWMVGFYDEKSDKISSFLVDEKDCTFDRTDEVFKRPEDKVLALDKDKIKIDLEAVLDLVDKYLKEHYRHETVIKTILILQTLPEFGSVWNVTLVTQSFNAINMKISSEDGNLIDHKWSSLISYTKDDTDV